jgi:hypothetical protein
MKRLMMTTAIATMALTGAASAQSLLERVLTDLGTVAPTGIFANTADNLLAGAVPNTTTIGGTATTADRTLQVGDVILVTYDADGSGATNEPVTVPATVGANGALTANIGGTSTSVGTAVLGATVLTHNAGNLTVAASNLTPAGAASLALPAGTFEVATVTTTVGGDVFSTSGINASVTNILSGLDNPTASTGLARATEAVNALIGNISTTGLGAVNTGDITLSGANLSIIEDVDTAIAGTSEAISQQINQTVTQVGTTTGETFLALNSALNETNVNASVVNVMSGVNATIGRSGFEGSLTDTTFQNVALMDAAAISALTGGISTTGLGAVNTGTIVSGAQQNVQGVIGQIVGNAATNVTP